MEKNGKICIFRCERCLYVWMTKGDVYFCPKCGSMRVKKVKEISLEKYFWRD